MKRKLLKIFLMMLVMSMVLGVVQADTKIDSIGIETHYVSFGYNPRDGYIIGNGGDDSSNSNIAYQSKIDIQAKVPKDFYLGKAMYLESKLSNSEKVNFVEIEIDKPEDFIIKKISHDLIISFDGSNEVINGIVHVRDVATYELKNKINFNDGKLYFRNEEGVILESYFILEPTKIGEYSIRIAIGEDNKVFDEKEIVINVMEPADNEKYSYNVESNILGRFYFTLSERIGDWRSEIVTDGSKAGKINGEVVFRYNNEEHNALKNNVLQADGNGHLYKKELMIEDLFKETKLVLEGIYPTELAGVNNYSIGRGGGLYPQINFTNYEMEEMGNIYGVLKDTDGNILINKEIILRPIGWKSSTNEVGEYSFKGVKYGNYTVSILEPNPLKEQGRLDVVVDEKDIDKDRSEAKIKLGKNNSDRRVDFILNLGEKSGGKMPTGTIGVIGILSAIAVLFFFYRPFKLELELLEQDGKVYLIREGGWQKIVFVDVRLVLEDGSEVVETIEVCKNFSQELEFIRNYSYESIIIDTEDKNYSTNTKIEKEKI